MLAKFCSAGAAGRIKAQQTAADCHHINIQECIPEHGNEQNFSSDTTEVVKMVHCNHQPLETSGNFNCDKRTHGKVPSNRNKPLLSSKIRRMDWGKQLKIQPVLKLEIIAGKIVRLVRTTGTGNEMCDGDASE